MSTRHDFLTFAIPSLPKIVGYAGYKYTFYVSILSANTKQRKGGAPLKSFGKTRSRHIELSKATQLASIARFKRGEIVRNAFKR
jgi:hypothetical protein